MAFYRDFKDANLLGSRFIPKVMGALVRNKLQRNESVLWYRNPSMGTPEPSRGHWTS